MREKEELFVRLKESIVNFDIPGVEKLASETVKSGVPAYEVIMKGMNPGMEIIGKKYEEGEYFISDLLMAGETIKAGMNVLKPYLKSAPIKSIGKVVIGTVEGDVHDIGKNILSTLLTSSGFEVYDLGVDVKAEQFIDKIQEVKADILAMSALLTGTMDNMEKIVKELENKGIRKNIRIIVGGGTC